MTSLNPSKLWFRFCQRISANSHQILATPPSLFSFGTIMIFKTIMMMFFLQVDVFLTMQILKVCQYLQFLCGLSTRKSHFWSSILRSLRRTNSEHAISLETQGWPGHSVTWAFLSKFGPLFRECSFTVSTILTQTCYCSLTPLLKPSWDWLELQNSVSGYTSTRRIGIDGDLAEIRRDSQAQRVSSPVGGSSWQR